MKGVYRYWRDGALQDVVEPWEQRGKAKAWQLSGQRIVQGQIALNVEAQYRGAFCTGMSLTWLSSGPLRRAELTAPPDALLFPLLRAATGQLLPLLAESPRTVLVPNLRDPHSVDFLKPLRSIRHAQRLDESTNHFRYYGGEYGDAGAEYWLNAQGLVERYRWRSAQGEWESRLEAFECSKHFSGH